MFIFNGDYVQSYELHITKAFCSVGVLYLWDGALCSHYQGHHNVYMPVIKNGQKRWPEDPGSLRGSSQF